MSCRLFTFMLFFLSSFRRYFFSLGVGLKDFALKRVILGESAGLVRGEFFLFPFIL